MTTKETKIDCLEEEEISRTEGHKSSIEVICNHLQHCTYKDVINLKRRQLVYNWGIALVQVLCHLHENILIFILCNGLA